MINDNGSLPGSKWDIRVFSLSHLCIPGGSVDGLIGGNEGCEAGVDHDMSWNVSDARQGHKVISPHISPLAPHSAYLAANYSYSPGLQLFL